MTTEYSMLYQQKRMSAEDAVALIPSAAKIAMGLGAAQPPALLNALRGRLLAGNVDQLRLYYMLSGAIAADTILDNTLSDRLTPFSFFHSPVERALDQTRTSLGQAPVEFMPTHFSNIPEVMCNQVGVDTLLTTVSPMDDQGCFSLGTNTDYAMAVARSGARLILEVNPNMPRVHGDCRIHVSEVAALVENSVPLTELSQPVRSAADDAIGAIIAGLVDDGACLQMGIGALPDAVCAALKDHRHLGIHTEMMTAGLVQLIQAGVVDNSRKQIHRGRSVFSFAMGDRAFYDFLHDNPDLEALPVEYVNNPAVIGQNDRVVSVNATLEVDLFGACNSEYLNGRQFSASGGQLDFVRGAHASSGGISVIACHSTAARGSVSRIVPRLSGPVTTPRNDTHIIVTEHGYADLKGKSVRERAKALIAIAPPDFRETLERSAFDQGIL